jgi:AhpC/TSA family
MTRLIFSVVLLTLMTASLPVSAIERGPLPAFTAVTATGAAVSSAALSSETKWLLIYVVPGNPACNKMLTALQAWASPAFLSRVVLVVGGKLESSQPFIESRAATTTGAYTWYADPDGAAAKALQIQFVPTVVAVTQGKIEWTLGGVLNDPPAIESVLRTWIEY